MTADDPSNSGCGPECAHTQPSQPPPGTRNTMTSGLVNLRIAIDQSNCIVITDAHGNVVTTVTNVARWVDRLIYMKVLQDCNENVKVTQQDGPVLLLGTEGMAL